MRALVQRVTRARVTVDDETVGEIGPGLCVLVGVTHEDGAEHADRLAHKVWHLRVFGGDERAGGGAGAGGPERSVAEAGGRILVVSQFTLYGDTSRGRRPSWMASARPDQAEPLIERFATALVERGATVATGRFRAHMVVELANDGPVTLLVEV